jgi:hypothetical protein
VAVGYVSLALTGKDNSRHFAVAYGEFIQNGMTERFESK